MRFHALCLLGSNRSSNLTGKGNQRTSRPHSATTSTKALILTWHFCTSSYNHSTPSPRTSKGWAGEFKHAVVSANTGACAQPRALCMYTITPCERQGWLSSFETALFDEKDGEEKEERCRAAAAFAASRRDMGWRLTHDDLYNVRARGCDSLVSLRVCVYHICTCFGKNLQFIFLPACLSVCPPVSLQPSLFLPSPLSR